MDLLRTTSHSTFLLLMGREARGKGHSTSASMCISVFVLLLAKAGTNGMQTGVYEVGDVLPTPPPSSTTLSWGKSQLKEVRNQG